MKRGFLKGEHKRFFDYLGYEVRGAERSQGPFRLVWRKSWRFRSHRCQSSSVTKPQRGGKKVSPLHSKLCIPSLRWISATPYFVRSLATTCIMLLQLGISGDFIVRKYVRCLLNGSLPCTESSPLPVKMLSLTHDLEERLATIRSSKVMISSWTSR